MECEGMGVWRSSSLGRGGDYNGYNGRHRWEEREITTDRIRGGLSGRFEWADVGGGDRW
jgi:hypothetical protein